MNSANVRICQQSLTKLKVGNVAHCKQGKLGIITNVKKTRVSVDCEGHTLYLGVGFDGKPWQSCSPVYISESVDEYICCKC